MKDITLVELFSGIGGFAKGLQEAGFNITKHYYSEIDKNAIANYKYNFKNAEYIGSVTDVRGKDLERPDIITFGSPCQDFSLAGKRIGMEGQRSSLIREAIRIVSEVRPSVFIWENVKGAFSSNGGADFWAILAAFADIGGYRLEWQLLNTSWFLPQNRERIYLIGHLAGRSEPGVFPIGETNQIHNRSKPVKEEVYTNNRTALTQQARQYASWNGDFIKVKQINDKKNFGDSTKQQDRIYDTSGIMACLGSHRLESKVNIITNTKKGHDTMTENDSVDLKLSTSKTRRGTVAKGKTQTLDTQCNLGVLQDSSIRRLTEIECERLQGFPDDWTKYGNYDGSIKEISKTQRYKMCGNAVTTKIVAAIGKRIQLANCSDNGQ